MFISKEDYDGLVQAIGILSRICKNAVFAELEDERAKNFELKLNRLDLEESRDTLKFTEKEILKMPQRFRKLMRVDGFTVHVRRRKLSANGYHYEARYRANGFNISVSSTDFEKLKGKFIAAVESAELDDAGFKVPRTFHEFSMYFFETFRQRKVSKRTFRADNYRYNHDLKGFFGSMPLRDITPGLCQKLIDKIMDAGHPKSAEEVYSLLNVIFKSAIAHNVMKFNPLSIVIRERHEREHGKALTKDEEKTLLTTYAGTPFELMFAVALYTGLRPNEYETARIEGQFIIAVNSKRKHKRVEYKKIPISPMLAPYLKNVSELKFYVLNRIREKFRLVLPNHRLYDLRTTFYTRCQECNVAPAARDEFVGHSAGVLVDTYTDLSDEFLLKEGQKLFY